MKRVLGIILSILIVEYGIFKLNIEPNIDENNENINRVEGSLKGGNDKIEANYYKNGFDFNYDLLPVIDTRNNKETLSFDLSNEKIKEIIVSEDYYKTMVDSSRICEKETYSIENTEDGIFELNIERRGNVKDEKAIYYIKYDDSNDGVFVFQVDFLIDKN